MILLKYFFFFSLFVFTPLTCFSQNNPQEFLERKQDCYSLETGIYISNEGNDKYKMKPANQGSENELTKKYLFTLEKSVKQTKQEVDSWRNFQDVKDVTFAAGAAYITETVKYSSIIVDPLMEFKNIDNRKRAEAFEKRKIAEVNKVIQKGIDDIVKEGNPEELRNFLNSEVPLFEFVDNKVEYNKVFTDAVSKLGEIERQRLEKIITKNKADISKLFVESKNTIKKVAELETWAIASYKENKQIIEANSRQIQANSKGIKENNRLIKQNSLRVSILEKTMVNHEVRISNNTRAIEKINLNMTWDRASLEEKINGLKNGNYDDLFTKEDGTKDKDAIEKLIVDSENLKLRKDISTAADLSARWGKAASQLFGESHPEVAKIADAAVQVSSIVGNYALGNYPEAAMGAMSMLGIGGGGPDPNTVLLKQVLKELDEMRKEMRKRFDKIDQTLELIRKDISGIENYLVAMNKDIRVMHVQTQSQLTIIQSKLDLINKKLDCIESKVNSIQLKDINVCEIPSSKLKEVKIKTYSEFLKAIENSKCNRCVQFIEDFINRGKLTKDVFDYVECDLTEEKTVNDIEIYLILNRFWRKYWSQNYAKAYDAMLYPPKYVVKNTAAYNDLVLSDLNFNYREYEILNNDFSDRLKSPLIIERVSRYFLTFYPVLEIYDGNGNYKDFSNALKSFQDVGGTAQNDFINYLIELVDYAITQQTLLSGHLMLNRFQQILKGKDGKEINELNKLLNNNDILMYNLINSYLVGRNIKDSPKQKVDLASEDKNIDIWVEKKTEQRWIFNIKRKYEHFGEKWVDISIPMNPISKENNNPEFLPTEDFFKLIEIRKKLKEKQIEIEFVKLLNIEENNNGLTMIEFQQLLT